MEVRLCPAGASLCVSMETSCSMIIGITASQPQPHLPEDAALQDSRPAAVAPPGHAVRAARVSPRTARWPPSNSSHCTATASAQRLGWEQRLTSRRLQQPEATAGRKVACMLCMLHVMGASRLHALQALRLHLQRRGLTTGAPCLHSLGGAGSQRGSRLLRGLDSTPAGH